MYARHDREEYHNSHGCAVTDRNGNTTFHRYSDLNQPSLLQTFSSCLCTLFLVAVLVFIGYLLVALQWQGKTEEEAWQQVGDAADLTYNLTAAQVGKVTQDPRFQQVVNSEWLEVATNQTVTLTQRLTNAVKGTLQDIYLHLRPLASQEQSAATPQTPPTEVPHSDPQSQETPKESSANETAKTDEV